MEDLGDGVAVHNQPIPTVGYGILAAAVLTSDDGQSTAVRFKEDQTKALGISVRQFAIWHDEYVTKPIMIDQFAIRNLTREPYQIRDAEVRREVVQLFPV